MDKACGLDVHKDSVFACILNEQGKKIFEKRFGTLTSELDELRDTLAEHDCHRVAMESTSIYWMPVWRVLEANFELKLANPYFIRQLPGRKSDVKDAAWIAGCLQKDLIRGSFVAGEVLQLMRQYTRQHRRLTKNRVRVEQQMDNQLQRCNIRFSNYVSNQGRNVSMRKIIMRLIAGERDPVKLSRSVHGRTLNKHGKEVITDSLNGVIGKADVEMLKQCMEQIELIEKQQATCLNHLEELANQFFAEEISLLCTIPGIKIFSALCILAEIGSGMSAFQKATCPVGWAGMKPGNDETSEKIKSRKILHGNKYLLTSTMRHLQISYPHSQNRRTTFQIRPRHPNWCLEIYIILHINCLQNKFLRGVEVRKIKSRKILHGNKYLRKILVEISWSVARSNKSFPGRKFRVLSKRMKSQ